MAAEGSRRFVGALIVLSIAVSACGDGERLGETASLDEASSATSATPLTSTSSDLVDPAESPGASPDRTSGPEPGGEPIADPVGEARQKWRASEITDYDLHYQRGSAWEGGAYVAYVRSGELLAFEFDRGRFAPVRGVDIDTVESLFEELTTLNPAATTVSYDQVLGYPQEMRFDEPDWIDEERHWSITELVPVGPEAPIPARWQLCTADGSERQQVHGVGSRNPEDIAAVVAGLDPDSHCLANLPPLGLITYPYAAPWELASDVAPASTTITVLVDDPIDGCGHDPRGRIAGIEVFEDERYVEIAVILEPLPWGEYECQGWPPLPVEIELDAPLADRQLVGGDPHIPHDAA